MSFVTGYLKTLFGIYAALIILLVILVGVPFYFVLFATNVFGNRTPHVAHKISIAMAKTLFTFYLIRINVIRKHNLKKDGVYIFVSNHTSLLDVPLCAIVTPITFRYLSKQELVKIPLFGYIIRKLYLSVNRKNEESRALSMEKMKQSLSDGISIYLFPEGTRNKTNEPLKDFYDGAFRLSIETGIPIVPMTIRNSKKLLDGYKMKPGTLECLWSDAIYPAFSDSTESLKARVRQVMKNDLMLH